MAGGSPMERKSFSESDPLKLLAFPGQVFS